MLHKIKQKISGIPLEVKASVSYTICSILQRCLSFITLPLFTRLLTQEQYGQYTVYQSWVSIFTIFITLNLAFGSFSTAMVKFEKDRYGYIAAVQNLCVVIALIFLAIYLPFRNTWNAFLEMPTMLVFLMLGEILMQFSLLCWYTYHRFDYKYKSVIFVTLITSILAPLSAYILVSLSPEKGYARIFGYALVTIVFGLVFFIMATVRGKGGLNFRYWKYALGFNIPLIPYYLSQTIFNQSDRIMISQMSGTSDAAKYGVAYTLATMLSFVLNAINNSYVPWFYNKIKEGNTRENRSISNGISLLMAFILLAVIALAPEVILILAGESYADAAYVVPPVAMSILLLFYSQLFINVEFYYEEKTALVWGSIAAAVLNIVLNFILIPIFGYIAAGYTTLVSYIAFAVANYFTLHLISKKHHVHCDYFDLKSLIGIFVIFAALSFLAMALYTLPAIRYAIVATVLLALIIFHKKVIAFVTSVLKRN